MRRQRWMGATRLAMLLTLAWGSGMNEREHESCGAMRCVTGLRLRGLPIDVVHVVFRNHDFLIKRVARLAVSSPGSSKMAENHYRLD